MSSLELNLAGGGTVARGSAAPASRDSARIEPVDKASFSSNGIGAIRHDFQHHPLMQLDALSALAKRLMPTQQCRFVRPGLSTASDFDHASAPHDGRGIDEVFARIEEPGSWIAMYNVQTDPLYRQFVDEVAAAFRPLVENKQPGVYEVGGFIFVSAPPSVTPFHIDRENNFWLQVRGRKTMNVWDHNDRVAVPQPAVENFVVHGGLSGVDVKDGERVRDDIMARSREFEVGPGDGVYFPMTSPHMTRTSTDWVKPGDGVSISIGVVFYTSMTRRMCHAHAFNRVARRLGLNPRTPQHGSEVEGWRAWLGRCVIALHGMTRGWKPPRGF